MRNAGKALVALSFLALAGCFVYVPVNGDPPPSGKEVRAHLRPARDFGVGELTVRDVTRVEGVMYTGTPDTIAVWSSWFHTALGTRFGASNSVIYIPRSEIPRLEVRKLHPARTVVALGVVAAIGTGVLTFITNPGGEQNENPPDVIETRVISSR